MRGNYGLGKINLKEKNSEAVSRVALCLVIGRLAVRAAKL